MALLLLIRRGFMSDLEKLRIYLNDKEEKMFTDQELALLLSEEGCLYCAAAEGWTLMTMKLDISGTSKYTVGIETYEKSSLNDQIRAALNNSAHFKSKCTCKTLDGSFILRTSTGVGF